VVEVVVTPVDVVVVGSVVEDVVVVGGMVVVVEAVEVGEAVVEVAPESSEPQATAKSARTAKRLKSL
jgi:hypothetical protein